MIPLERTRNGRISAISNQETGPRPTEKKIANAYRPNVSSHNIPHMDPNAILACAKPAPTAETINKIRRPIFSSNNLEETTIQAF